MILITLSEGETQLLEIIISYHNQTKRRKMINCFKVLDSVVLFGRGFVNLLIRMYVIHMLYYTMCVIYTL